MTRPTLPEEPRRLPAPELPTWPDPLVILEDAAQRTGLTVKQLRNGINEGLLEGFKPRKYYSIRISEVLRYIESSWVQPGSLTRSDRRRPR